MPLSPIAILRTFKYAMYFNGTNAYASVADNPSISIPGDYTICLWFAFTQNPSAPQVMSGKWYNNPREYYIGYYPSGAISHYRTDASGNLYGASWSLTPQLYVWYYACGVTRGTTLEIWGNGTLEGTGPFPGVSTIGTGNLVFGENDGVGQYFPGYINNILLYNRALSDSEIQWNYNNPDSPITSGLVLWLKADPAYIQGTTWLDLSGNNNNATLHNTQLVQLINPPIQILPPIA